MEVIEKILKYRRPDVFRLYPFGDIHAGSINCAEGEVKKQVDAIAKDPKALWIGMGDYADCIIRDDTRFQQGGLAEWVEDDNIVESQREWLKNILKPIADKCICLLDGNHENNIRKRYQNHLTWNLCKDLGIPYGGYQCFIQLTLRRALETQGSRQYIIHAWHGSGAAQTEGARLMRLMRLVNDIQAHIYLMGHLHAMTQHTPDRLICYRGRIKSTRLVATMTGGWLKGYTQSPNPNKPLPPNYIEEKGYKPLRIGCPVVEIIPDKDEFYVKS